MTSSSSSSSSSSAPSLAQSAYEAALSVYEHIFSPVCDSNDEEEKEDNQRSHISQNKSVKHNSIPTSNAGSYNNRRVSSSISSDSYGCIAPGCSNDTYTVIDDDCPMEEEEEADVGDTRPDDEKNEVEIRLKKAFDAFLREPYRDHNHGEERSGVKGVTRIRHCRQMDTWDCGIACIQMVISWLREEKNDFRMPASVSNNNSNTPSPLIGLTKSEPKEKNWMLSIVDTHSVWTIDLVILLEHLIDNVDPKNTNGLPALSSSTIPTITSIAKTKRRSKKQKGRLNATYLFCSTNLGVDESYHGLCYYKKTFQKDEIRVTQRFALAQTLGLPTLSVSNLSLHHVINIVSRENCVAIVLLDNRVLKRRQRQHRGRQSVSSTMDDDTTTQEDVDKETEPNCEYPNDNESSNDDIDDASSSSSSIDSYTGHYVVLCGVSYDKDDVAVAEIEEQGDRSGIIENNDESLPRFCMVIKNPSSSNATDFVTPTHFERAWRANGTDEDVIFVAKHTK